MSFAGSSSGRVADRLAEADVDVEQPRGLDLLAGVPDGVSEESRVVDRHLVRRRLGPVRVVELRLPQDRVGHGHRDDERHARALRRPGRGARHRRGVAAGQHAGTVVDELLGDFAAELLCALVVPADDAELCPVERLDAARLVLHHRGQSDRLVHALAGVAERPAQRVVRPDDHLVWGVAAVASVTASAATTIAAVAAITAVAAVAAVTATASQGTGDAGRTAVFDKRPSTDTIRGISSHTRFVCDG